jgi:hypothetical protein
MIHANFVELGLKLPLLWGKVLVWYPDPATLTLGFILYIVIFAYLYFTFSFSSTPLPSSSLMRSVAIAGFLVFFLGYAIFAANNNVGFSPTGIDNRVTIASSIGIALILVGLIGWLSKSIRSEIFAKWLFCVLVSVVSVGGFVIIATIASFWNLAYAQTKTVLSDIEQNVPTFPKNSVFILDGVCPYQGPGIVFESQWDLKGALQIVYKDPTIQADIVTPRLKLGNEGIQTQTYTFRSDYPYSSVFIYNFKNKQLYAIRDRAAGEVYFQTFNPDFNNDCPPASAGNGVKIF